MGPQAGSATNTADYTQLSVYDLKQIPSMGKTFQDFSPGHNTGNAIQVLTDDSCSFCLLAVGLSRLCLSECQDTAALESGKATTLGKFSPRNQATWILELYRRHILSFRFPKAVGPASTPHKEVGWESTSVNRASFRTLVLSRFTFCAGPQSPWPPFSSSVFPLPYTPHVHYCLLSTKYWLASLLLSKFLSPCGDGAP